MLQHSLEFPQVQLYQRVSGLHQRYHALVQREPGVKREGKWSVLSDRKREILGKYLEGTRPLRCKK